MPNSSPSHATILATARSVDAISAEQNSTLLSSVPGEAAQWVGRRSVGFADHWRAWEAQCIHEQQKGQPASLPGPLLMDADRLTADGPNLYRDQMPAAAKLLPCASSP